MMFKRPFVISKLHFKDINWNLELRDTVTAHVVFQCVLLSPVTLNRIL